MQIQKNVLLKPYTSLHVGGNAEEFILCKNVDELEEALSISTTDSLHVFGYGTNSLISDKGLPGLTVIYKGGDIMHNDTTVIADAGVWWDDLIDYTLRHKLWGLELTSGIPSSVGGAVVGNIAAYGQQISDMLTWIEVFDTKAHQKRIMMTDEIRFEYRASSLQSQSHLIIIRAAFTLSKAMTTPLSYASATTVAEELGLNSEDLEMRKEIITEARRRAGSLYDPEKPESYTAGSFFKNPLVTQHQAEKIAAFDETGKSMQLLLDQNKIHGGDSRRTSAAHVLLAAGFKRGQTWGYVRLHPDHILKIENTGKATAQEIHNVAHEIMRKVKDQLNITLTPEVRFFGAFDSVE